MNEETKYKTILTHFLQDVLSGHLDVSSNLNPSFLADAILTKLEINKTLAFKNTEEAVKSFTSFIEDIDSDMDKELNELKEGDLMLKNFIRGQKTACEKLKGSLNTLYEIKSHTEGQIEA